MTWDQTSQMPRREGGDKSLTERYYGGRKEYYGSQKVGIQILGQLDKSKNRAEVHMFGRQTASQKRGEAGSTDWETPQELTDFKNTYG